MACFMELLHIYIYASGPPRSYTSPCPPLSSALEDVIAVSRVFPRTFRRDTLRCRSLRCQEKDKIEARLHHIGSPMPFYRVDSLHLQQTSDFKSIGSTFLVHVCLYKDPGSQQNSMPCQYLRGMENVRCSLRQ